MILFRNASGDVSMLYFSFASLYIDDYLAILDYSNHYSEVVVALYSGGEYADQNKEEQQTYALSRGESFRVSLGVALSLVFVSFGHIKGKFLFIDAGFGSLDSTTLNIDMDTLENSTIRAVRWGSSLVYRK